MYKIIDYPGQRDINITYNTLSPMDMPNNTVGGYITRIAQNNANVMLNAVSGQTPWLMFISDGHDHQDFFINYKKQICMPGLWGLHPWDLNNKFQSYCWDFNQFGFYIRTPKGWVPYANGIEQINTYNRARTKINRWSSAIYQFTEKGLFPTVYGTNQYAGYVTRSYGYEEQFATNVTDGLHPYSHIYYELNDYNFKTGTSRGNSPMKTTAAANNSGSRVWPMCNTNLPHGYLEFSGVNKLVTHPDVDNILNICFKNNDGYSYCSPGGQCTSTIGGRYTIMLFTSDPKFRNYPNTVVKAGKPFEMHWNDALGEFIYAGEVKMSEIKDIN